MAANKVSINQKINAFSLVEMSVVIVVIGLLVGGVTVAQSYIKNSQLTAIAMEAKYYTSAFEQFQTVYKSVPGDMFTANASWSAAQNGDGNTVISATGTGNTPNTAEIFYAFQHLSLAGFIEGTYSGTGPTAVPGVNVPRSSYPDAAWIFDHPAALDGNVSGDTLYFDGFYPHVLRIGIIQGTLPNAPLLTGAQALKLDSKFDDGLPGSGAIMTPKHSALANCTTSDVVANAVYLTGSTNATCYLFFKVQ